MKMIFLAVGDVLEVDKEVMVSDILTDQEIVNQVKPQVSQLMEVDNDLEDDDEIIELPPPPYKEVEAALTVLKRYTESKPNAAKEISMVYDLEDRLSVLQTVNLTQTKITDFVHK
jgi:hypothetical protein